MNHDPMTYRYSTDQLLDASGTIDDQVKAGLGSQRHEFYDPTTEELPRPDYASALYLSYGDAGYEYQDGVMMERADFPDLAGPQWHNMRVAIGMRSRDNRLVWSPGLVGPDGSAAYLAADMIADPNTHGSFSDLQQLALDNAYLTLASSAEHGRDNVNAAESRHGLILASAGSPAGVHERVHTIDQSGDFTTAANAAGLQDITTAYGTRQVRPQVIPLSSAYAVAIRPEFQVPAEPLFGIEISPQQLLLASTLAASRTRGTGVNIGDNVAAMAERQRGA